MKKQFAGITPSGGKVHRCFSENISFCNFSYKTGKTSNRTPYYIPFNGTIRRELLCKKCWGNDSSIEDLREFGIEIELPEAPAQAKSPQVPAPAKCPWWKRLFGGRMGLFSWIFGKRALTPAVIANLPGPGTYSLDVVGESYYQVALESICGGRSNSYEERIVEAILIHEDDNPYDNQAISINIHGKKVGHLSRSDARKYRKEMERAGYPGITATCSAMIVGGWDRGGGDQGHFGVKLDLPTDDRS